MTLRSHRGLGANVKVNPVKAFSLGTSPTPGGGGNNGGGNNGGGQETIEMIYGSGSVNFQNETDGIFTETGGTTEIGPADDYYISITYGLVKNYGTFKIGGGITLELTGNYGGQSGGANTIQSLIIGSSGTVQLGETENDYGGLTIGGYENGQVTLTVNGSITSLGGGGVTVDNASGSGNTNVTIAEGGALNTSPTSNFGPTIYGNLTVSEVINWPDNNSQIGPGVNGVPSDAYANGVLAMYTHTNSGLAYEFTDGSYADGSTGDITSWLWQIVPTSGSNITIGTTQNPSYTFEAAGSYYVMLTVTTADGQQSSAQETITASA